MPSLKDLRNRIASVKATQKITKAMQMVAAAKLRRAQTAAEAARPYANRMEAVLANLATALKGREGGPPLMVGTGRDQVHLLVVCTAERGLCGAFNSSIVRLAREHINRLLADGKQVKILCVGKKGYDQLRRLYAPLIIDLIELRGVRQLSFEHGRCRRPGRRGLIGLSLLFRLRVDRLDTTQQIERVIELGVLVLLGRHIGRAAGLLVVIAGRALLIRIFALEVTAQIGFATRAERVGLLLEIVRQFLLDHNLGLDALGLNRAARRRVIARGGKPERTVRA